MILKNKRCPTGKSALPFLKWPGGKRWLTPTLLNHLRGQTFETYHEPFLGGGALFFALRPSRAVISDINGDLINVYRQVKYHPSSLVNGLQPLPVTKRTYESIRKWQPECVLDRAIRFLYLNRTAFAGMYRLNQNGQFNVPYGGGERTPVALWETGLIRTASRVLQSAQLRVCDFEEVMAATKAGDLVYCDPTYTVAHNNNGFVRYNEKNFSWEDQKRLATCCQAASRRGALVIVSNACHDELLRLFDPPRHFPVVRQNRLCPRIEHRRATEEYLFIFPPKTCTQRG